VVVVGKNRLAVGCLEIVVASAHAAILALADPTDPGTDGWQPSFRAAAERLGVPCRTPADLNDPEFVAELAAFGPDFLLSFQAAQIMRRPLIQTPRVAALNLHFGPLPRYRGVAPIAWAIINGEAATGVTLHHISAGIDSGPIAFQADVPVGPSDTGRAVYDRCTEAGIALFREAWPRILSGELPSVAQRTDAALYYNRHSIDFARRRIDWHHDAAHVSNWTRAVIFPPFQHPVVVLDGREYEVGGVRWDRGAHPGRPGEILAVEDHGVLVAAPGGRVLLGPLMRGGVALDAADLAAAGFAIGSLLES
jgi:methionyl-tRNA formyltransferase